jgi:hypothetical protein
LEYRKGWERIPKDWYRAPVDYGLVQLDLDIIDFVSKYPELDSIGGNTGTVNSFTGVDIGNLTSGVYNIETLLQGNNLICFVFEFVKTVSPDMISGIYTLVDGPLAIITNTFASPLLDLACPALKDLSMGGMSWKEGIQSLFPGAKKSGGGL